MLYFASYGSRLGGHMSSQEIFELRRNGDLLAGYNLGKKLLSIDPSDNWVLKAFSYCTLDLAKKFASESKYDLAKIGRAHV